jgi:hypothetical protein
MSINSSWLINAASALDGNNAASLKAAADRTGRPDRSEAAHPRERLVAPSGLLTRAAGTLPICGIGCSRRFHHSRWIVFADHEITCRKTVAGGC